MGGGGDEGNFIPTERVVILQPSNLTLQAIAGDQGVH